MPTTNVPIKLQNQPNKLHYLKRRVNNENMSLRNHLMSVVHDSSVVEEVKEFVNLKLFANLRNGKWYSPSFDGHCYFKSTDGHESHWTFSLSRMNLELARVAALGGAIGRGTGGLEREGNEGNRGGGGMGTGKGGGEGVTGLGVGEGCEGKGLGGGGVVGGMGGTGRRIGCGAIIVDSTRQGKLFPDSMTATIPIWCAVINTIVFQRPFLLSPPPWLPPSSLSQINLLLPSFVLSVCPTLQGVIRGLLGPILKAPFRCVWAGGDEEGVLEWYGEAVDEFLDHSCNSGTGDGCRGDSDDQFDSSGSSGSSSSSGDTYGNSCTNSNNSNSSNNSSSSHQKPLPFTPLVLLSCSPPRSDNTHNAIHSWKYIQGAGDDEENWGQGLSAESFWKNKNSILSSDDPKVVEETVRGMLLKGERGHGQQTQSQENNGQTQGHGQQTDREVHGQQTNIQEVHGQQTNIQEVHGQRTSAQDEGVSSGIVEVSTDVGSVRSAEGKTVGGGKDSGNDTGCNDGEASGDNLNTNPHMMGHEELEEPPVYTSSSTAITPAVFAAGLSGVNIGVRSLLTEQRRGGGENEGNRGGKESDMVRRLILTSPITGLRGVIIFQQPDANTSNKDKSIPYSDTLSLSLPSLSPPASSTSPSSNVPSSLPNTSTPSSSFLPCTPSLPPSIPPSPPPSLPPSLSPSLPPSLPPPSTTPCPTSLPPHIIPPPYNDVPCLVLRAGSSKKDSSGQSRSLWCNDIIPACIAFYKMHCENGANMLSGDGKGHSGNSTDTVCNGSNDETMCNGSILIVCEDGMLSVTIAVALLLSHYRTSLDFRFTHYGTPGQCFSNDKGQSLSNDKGQCLSKEDIKACLTMLQMHVPIAAQLPRRLMKELNMFFSTYRSRR